MANTGTIVSIRSLSKSYANGAQSKTSVMDGVDLDVLRNEFLCILGPTGCGKTTLLRIVAGLESPDRGTVEIGLNSDGKKASLGFMFQQHALFPWMTVEKNIAFGLRASNVNAREIQSRCRESLQTVGLLDSATAHPYELSGGMQRRAALARTIAPHPDVVLLDEPFSALDVATARSMYDAVVRIHQQTGMTFIVVTHNIEEAVFLADRVVVMDAGPGTIAADVPIGLDRPRDRFAEPFIQTMLHVREYFEKGNVEKGK